MDTWRSGGYDSGDELADFYALNEPEPAPVARAFRARGGGASAVRQLGGCDVAVAYDATSPRMRVARGPHPIRVSGPAKALCDMVLSLAEQAMVAPPPNADDAVLVPYTAVAWLLLPTLWASTEDLPLQAFLYRYVVDPTRMGAALAAMLAGGLDVSPCSAGVARARLKACAKRLKAEDPAPFTVAAADFYLVEIPAAALPPGTVNLGPDEARTIGIEHIMLEDGSLEALGSLEPALWPRVLVADRQDGGGWTAVFAIAEAYAYTSLPPPVAALTQGVRGAELGRVLKGSIPDVMLACYASGAEAWAAISARIPVALGISEPAKRLTGVEVKLAVAHLNTLSLNARGLSRGAAPGAAGAGG